MADLTRVSISLEANLLERGGMIVCGVLLIYGSLPALATAAVVLAATLGLHMLRTRLAA